MALGLATSLLLGLYVARVFYSGAWTFGFLLWNAFLALVPWGLARLVERASARRQRATTAALLGAWLLFLPNAPYLVTDLLHLRARPPVPHWYDVLLLGTAALLGLLAGAFSLVRVQRVLRRHRGGRVARLVVLAAITLSGFGIYLGRFERFNSWDLILHPWTVLMRCLASLGPRSVVVTVACAALLAITYVSVSVGQSARPNRSR